jgi:cytochrome c-type biogenesis protein CcmF
LNNITYTGEHLLLGQLGNAFVFLSFAAALLAAFAYFRSAQNDELENGPWKKLGRIAFYTHSLAVIGIMTTLFCMIFKHTYEYYYVWEHSSNSMPKRYTLACFWEGQEGSFLLWTFWQVVLGNILLRSSKKWEAPVMSTLSLVQAFLASMLLGFYVFGIKIGSNPFILLRNTPEFVNLPLFQFPDYLSKLDGRGLNPLLQNYWMTIHPPTLFLGFASTIVPFVYAIAGLWKKKYGEWQLDALPWSFFGIMILGTGILMGGAWAYESLSFGGFWAWDPVENASLIPWLTFVGTGHILIIYKARKQSALSTFIFPIITFILVLYSTFLTRSGILGNTSVHAFTDLGLSGQLLVYLLFFIVLAIVLIIVNYKKIPKAEQEEELWSREFWMFLGALVLVMSCMQIIVITSIPVSNKIFGGLHDILPFFKDRLEKLSKQAPPDDRIGFYNRWQVPFAIIVTLLVAIGLFFKFKTTDLKQFVKQLTPPFITSVVVTVISAYFLKLTNGFFIALLFTSWFAVWANFHYWVQNKKANFLKGGATFAHLGFGLIIMGALISTSTKQVISVNTSGKNVETLGKDISNATDILLEQGDTLRMGDYFVTYTGKRKEGHNVLFAVQFFSKDSSTKKLTPKFTLNPLIQINPQMGNVAEPSTKHFITKDIYTHIMFADLNVSNDASNGNEYGEAKPHTLGVGDTMFSSNSIIILTALDTHIDKLQYHLKADDIAVGAVLKVIDVNDKIHTSEPVYVISNDMVKPIDATLPELGLKFSFQKIDPETHKMDFTISESKRTSKDFIVLEAVVFPYINVLWFGCLIMVLGTVLSIRSRIKKSREAKKEKVES